MVGVHGEHLIIVCSASWISGYGREHCQLDFWLWYRGGEHLIIMCSVSWISGYGIGAVSILLLCVLSAGFVAMVGVVSILLL